MTYIDYESLQDPDVSPVSFLWNVADYIAANLTPREAFQHYVSHTEPCVQDLAYWAFFKKSNHPFADQVNIASTISKMAAMFSQSCFVSFCDFVETVGTVRTPVTAVPTGSVPARTVYNVPVSGFRRSDLSNPYTMSYGAYHTLDQSILLMPVDPAPFESAGIFTNNDVELISKPTARHYTYIIRNRGSVDGLRSIVTALQSDPKWDNGEPKRILIPAFNYGDAITSLAGVIPLKEIV